MASGYAETGTCRSTQNVGKALQFKWLGCRAIRLVRSCRKAIGWEAGTRTPIRRSRVFWKTLRVKGINNPARQTTPKRGRMRNAAATRATRVEHLSSALIKFPRRCNSLNFTDAKLSYANISDANVSKAFVYGGNCAQVSFGGTFARSAKRFITVLEL
jgi:hypothetical protein